MLYYSTANPRHRVSLLEAVGRGLPPDGGVYMPERLPFIPKAFFNNMADMSLKDIGYVVANTLFGEDIAAADLKQIVAEAINFDTPLIPDPDNSGMYALELFHGPSGSYKDFGARFMAHTLRRIHCPDSQLNIIVATTGDAGEAVAHSFFGMPGTRVFILYPHVGTGMRQLSSFASLGGNIVPIEVRGSFAHCHDMVKSVFADHSIGRSMKLFAANSFNLARLLPQTIYYFYAYAQLMRSGADLSRLVITLPSGNLGNLTAGLIAKRMGLPASRIISVRTGEPDSFHSFIHQNLKPARIDDSGVPPNFWRLLDLYDGNRDNILADSGSIMLSPDTEASVSAGAGVGSIDRYSAAARHALSGLGNEASTRLYLATSIAPTATSDQRRVPFRPAATLPPSPAFLREFLLSYRHN